VAQKRKVPTIVIFTKYDKLVTKVMMAAMVAGDAVAHLEDEEIWQYSESKASEEAVDLCVRPWREAVGKVPMMVSTNERFNKTIQTLIKATDSEIQQQAGISSYTESSSLNFAAAQRLNNGIKTHASIDIGRLILRILE